METIRHGPSNRVNRLAEWRSKLNVWSNGALLFHTLTGLSI